MLLSLIFIVNYLNVSNDDDHGWSHRSMWPLINFYTQLPNHKYFEDFACFAYGLAQRRLTSLKTVLLHRQSLSPTIFIQTPKITPITALLTHLFENSRRSILILDIYTTWFYYLQEICTFVQCTSCICKLQNQILYLRHLSSGSLQLPSFHNLPRP